MSLGLIVSMVCWFYVDAKKLGWFAGRPVDRHLDGHGPLDRQYTEKEVLEEFHEYAISGDEGACHRLADYYIVRNRFDDAYPYFKILADKGDAYAKKVLVDPQGEMEKLKPR
ncbi:MAG TPA: hypothetical protein VF598_13150 [Hymenobacter sp.]